MDARRLKSLAALALAFAIVPARAPAQTPTPAPAPDALTLALQQRVAETPGVGIIVGEIDGDRTTIYKAGASGTSAPLDEHTLFEIGSVSKTFTATILASMVLDHSVVLDAPIAEFLPKNVRAPSRDGRQITLLNLATQHSGLPRLPNNLRPADPSDPYAEYSLEDLYRFLNAYALTRDPGAKFEYSNLGIGLLGDVLALRAHTSYAALLRARVLAPLGMDDTTIALSPEQQARFAAGHDADGAPAKPWTMRAIAPAGGIRSSVADMLKYVRCNMGRGALARSCLFAQKPRDAFPGNRIGLVWWISDVTNIVSHGGDTAGYHAAVAISADHHRGVVVLTNGGSTGAVDLAFHVLDPAFPLNIPTSAVPLDAATLDEYVGVYAAAKGKLTVTVTRDGTNMSVRLSGQPAARIYASAKDRFFYRVVDAQISFSRDANGKVVALSLHQDGQTLVATRSGAVAAAVAEPTYPPVAPLDGPTLDEYVGTYAVQPGVNFVVIRKDGGILAQLTGQDFYPLFASAKDHFYYKVVDAQIDFTRDAAGKVAGLVLHQAGRDLPAARK